MSALLAIASRELRLRRSVLWLALALGFVPVALNLYSPGVLEFAAMSPAGLALVVGASVLVMAGLSAGWSTIAGEASSGRLGFFFARPVPWWALWGGKLAAAVGLSAAAGLLATLPSLVTDLRGWRDLVSVFKISSQLPSFAAHAVLMVAGANAASVAYRGQPVRRVLDIALSVALLAILLSPSRLLTVGASSMGAGMPYAVLLAPLTIALVAGSAMQVRGGRMEPLRSHAFLSLTLWPLVLTSLAALAALGSFMWTALPRHLRRVTRVEAPARGSWIFVAGPVRWGQYSAAFLYEPATGRHISLGSANGMSRVSFAPDGSAVVIAETDMLDPAARRTRVVWLYAERQGLEKVFDFLPEEVSIAPGGEYLIASRSPREGSNSIQPAATCWRGLEFYKVPSGALINSVTASAVGVSGDCFQSPIVFQSDGRLRVYVEEMANPGTRYVHIVAADLGAFLVAGKAHASRLESTGSFPVGRNARLKTSPGGDRVLVLQIQAPRARRLGGPYQPDRSGWQICLRDGTSGEHVRTLVEGTETGDADFLSDGRVIVTNIESDSPVVHILKVGEELEESLDLSFPTNLYGAEELVVAGEISSGLLLTLGARSHATGLRVTVRASLQDDASWPRVEPRFYWGLYPALLEVGDRATLSSAVRPAPGSLASSLLITEQGRLMRCDPKTGALTVLLGGH